MERPAKFTIDTDPIRWKDIFNRYADVDPEERWKLSLELLDDDVVEELHNKFKWVMQQKLDVRQNILFEILPEITEKIKHQTRKGPRSNSQSREGAGDHRRDQNSFQRTSRRAGEPNKRHQEKRSTTTMNC